jgi:primosomal protein N'
MQIVSVYPLAKGVRVQQLDYYYTQPINRGTLVTVPFGNREITAVVADCETAENQKAQIRSAEYELKPVTLVSQQIFFTQFLSACEDFADFSGVTVGATLRALTPAPLIDDPEAVPDVVSDFLQPQVSAPPTNIIQATADKQIEYIRSLTQSRQQAGYSVFVCVPTIKTAQQIEKRLRTDKVIQLHSQLNKNALVDNWQQAVSKDEPTVLIGTPIFLSVPRSDLGHVIVAGESDDAYKMSARPFLDKALFARHLADTYKQPCTLSDRVLSTATLWEYEKDYLAAQHQPNFDYHKDITTELIDMTDLPDTDDSGVRVFSPELARMLRTVTEQDEQAVLFVARSGRRPFTACRDCGETVSCPQCGLPVSLVTDTDDDERKFICRTCKTEHSANRRCENCDSWHLQPLGIGIDFVTEILQNQLANASVYQIDTSSTSSDQAVQDTLDQFYDQPGSILTTTTLGINNLYQPVAGSGVVTADSLLAIPDLSVAHKLFHLLTTLREYTDERMMIQTRSRQTEIFQQALAGNVDGFYNQQIKQREQFNYPPFSYLVKLQINESKKRSQALLQTVKKELDNYQLQIYPDRRSNGINILTRINREDWVDPELLAKLRALPLAVSINAHPRSLL